MYDASQREQSRWEEWRAWVRDEGQGVVQVVADTWEAMPRKVETSCHPGSREESWKHSFQVKGRSRRGRDQAVWPFWCLKMKVQMPESGSSKKPLWYWPLVANEIFWPW